MSSISGAGGTVVYIRQSGGNIQSSTNQVNWSTLSFPVSVSNSNTAAGVLRIEFTTDLTITSISQYFNCSSSNIQFGSTSLKADGTRPTITISVGSYDGFIQNGTGISGGYNNIYVYNLLVDGTGYTTQVSGGWVCKAYFGNSATNNYIVNCASRGNLPGGATGSGGIVGAFAGSGSGATLYIYGCSSSGTMGQLDGGIVGAYAGQTGGTVTCEQCYATGTIGDFAGGIFGDYAGDGGSVSVVKCFTSGTIGGNAGGIFGRYAGNNGVATANRCYSRGTVGADGGGIYGLGAGSTGGFSTASNCYSAGTITTSGRGIYGSGKVNGTESQCYVANGSWSDVFANISLSGVPGSSGVGTNWIARGTNQPYELNAFGVSPYLQTNINSSSQLIQTYSASVRAGQATPAALNTTGGTNAYTILQITGGLAESYPSINMNIQTGTIFTNLNTAPGTYTITLRSVGSYRITTVTLTVTAIPSPYVGCSTICTSNVTNMGKLSYEFLNNRLIANTLVQNLSSSSSSSKPFLSYSEYIKILAMRR